MKRIWIYPPARRWPIAIATAVVVTIVLAVARPERNEDPATPVQTKPPPSVVAAQVTTGTTGTTPATTSAAASVVQSAAPTQISKAQAFENLIKTGNPADAFTAYKMTWKCRASDGASEFCGDLSPGQIASGYSLLRQAVMARVPGAAPRLFDRTPDGRDSGEAWDDPAYSSWKQFAWDETTAAAERGDVAALHHMSVLETAYGSRERALMFWVAYVDATDTPGKQRADAPHIAEVTALREVGLTPEQVATATAKGHAIKRRT